VWRDSALAGLVGQSDQSGRDEGLARCNPTSERLTGLLVKHPDRDRFWHTVTTAALNVARTVQTPRSSMAGAAGAVPAVQHDVRAAVGRHRIRARMLTPADGLTPGLIVVIVEPVKGETESATALQKRFCLTHRELDVTHLLSMEKSNADIAEALGISPYTARHHSESVLCKLGVRSRAEVPWVVLAEASAAHSTHVPLVAGHSD